jgi:hypothetical protein
VSGWFQSASDAGEVRPVIYAAASALSLIAGLVHLWVTPEHLVEWWGYGAFFLVCASAQALYAALLLSRRPGQIFLLSGLIGNFAVVILYVATRTVGIPFFGPHAGEVEEFSALGAGATAAELALIVALVSLLEGTLRKRVVNALFVSGVVLWVLGLFVIFI